MNYDRCGCEQHTIESLDNDVVLYRGLRWKPTCALKEALRLLSEKEDLLTDAIKQIEALEGYKKRLQIVLDRLVNIPCANCENPVGRHWTFHGDSVICVNCIHELGGEG